MSSAISNKQINIVNVSGGVDSTACYCLALESGKPFRAVFADTGNEHELTVKYVQNLHLVTGGPKVDIVKKDYAQKINVRRANFEQMITTRKYRKGWTEEQVSQVLELLHPTGIPFLDMCLYHGRFPASKTRFCTMELKREAIRDGAIVPAICEAVAQGGTARDVVSWVGIRHDESGDRAKMEEWDFEPVGSRIWRPLLDWPKMKCFDLLRRHDIDPNELYKLGMHRVGCMPCIMANKHEIYEIAARFPEHIEKIQWWEELVGKCSRRGVGTFFPADKTPGKGITRSHIKAVVEWSKTGRGGRQYSMHALQQPKSCSSIYGLCE